MWDCIKGEETWYTLQPNRSTSNSNPFELLGSHHESDMGVGGQSWRTAWRREHRDHVISGLEARGPGSDNRL